MDRKTIIILVCCVAGMLALNNLVNKIYPPIPVEPAGTNAVPAIPDSNAVISTTSSASVAAAPSASPALPVVATDLEEEFLVVTNQDTRFIFTSHGGGLKELEFFNYREDVSRHARKRANTNGLAALNKDGELPVLTVSGGESLRGDGVFVLSQTGETVRAEKLLTNGLRIVKEFRPSTNYLLLTSVRFENTGNVPLALPAMEIAIGTATPLGPTDDGMNVGLMWHNGARNATISDAWFANRTLGCFPGTPRAVFSDGQSNVVWAAAHNQFFGLVAIPATPAQEVIARQVKLRTPTADELPANAASLLAPDRKSTRLNSSHGYQSRMPSSA